MARQARLDTSTMLARAKAYLTFRRKIGFALESTGRAVRAFGRYADRIGHRGAVTTAIAVRWATFPGKGGPKASVKKLEAVRQFARYQLQFEPGTEVPPNGFLGSGYRRRAPHIYSDREVATLLHAAGRLSPHDGLRSRTYVALFSLLFATGMRVGEAARLTVSEVDLERGLIRVNKTKFRKSRLVPLHASAKRALKAYAKSRDRGQRHYDGDAAFFSHGQGRITLGQVRRTFAALRSGLGWGEASCPVSPRAYDIRHTFAVRRLLQWYKKGARVEDKITALSTYLGHVRVTDTYWYLTATPELLAAVSKRFEQYAGARRQPGCGP